MSTKPIPIIGQLFGYEVNPKFSKEVYNKVIFEKTINYNEIATISNTSIRNDKVYFYSYKIDDDTSIISSYEPDRDLRFNVMKNRAWGNAKKVIVTDPIFAESFESLFSGGKIEEVVNLRYLFSNKTKNIRSMFYKCNNLKSIDLSGFVTNSIVDCFSLFRDCKNLRYVNMSNLNMNNVNDFREVFLGCEALEEVRFDGSSFNNVKGIAYMFSGCKKIKTIDLSTFNLSNLQPVKNWTPKHITCAFANCSELETIYVSNEPDIDVIRGNRHKLIVAYDNVFIGCDKLVGGNGTSYIDIKNKYSHSFDDLDYACIDNELHEGLFTKK